MNLLINYTRHPRRHSPLNLLVGRILLGVYGIWKLLSYEWSGLRRWPRSLFANHGHGLFVPWDWVIDFIWWEVGVACLLLMAFIFGIHLRWVGVLGAVVIAHLSGVHYVITNAGATFLPLVYFLVFWGVFSHEDEISWDTFRRSGGESLDALNERLQIRRSREYSHSVFRWGLLVVAVTYFFTGFTKVQHGLLDWATAENLALILRHEEFLHLNELPYSAQLIIDNYWLSLLSAWGSVVLELGLLVAILIGLPLAPFVLGLLGLHTIIAIAMHIFFFDQYLLFLLFVPWDEWSKHKVPNKTFDVIYDETCKFCARSLLPFRFLGDEGIVTFYSQSTLPTTHEAVRSDLGRAIFASDEEGEEYWGYDVFERLLWVIWVLRPIAWIMRRRLVRAIGERVYQWVAVNRQRLSTCSVQ